MSLFSVIYCTLMVVNRLCACRAREAHNIQNSTKLTFMESITHVSWVPYTIKILELEVTRPVKKQGLAWHGGAHLKSQNLGS